MASGDDLLTRADQKLEDNQYTGALDDYRIAALLAPLSEVTLYNLRVAEEGEGLLFRQSLRLAHPESLIAHLAEPDHLAAMHIGPRAVQLYSEILDLFGHDPTSAIKIRSKRFNTLCRFYRTNYFTQLLDDFWTLWMMGDSLEQVKVMRQSLVSILIKELQDIESIAVFDSLTYDERLPKNVRALFEVKNVELKALKVAIEEVKVRRN
jgi:hypothetical protein